MNQNGMYYVTDEFKQLIRNLGGEWNDQKKRPIVCLIQSSENPELYWAIPVGKVNHREKRPIQRWKDWSFLMWQEICFIRIELFLILQNNNISNLYCLSEISYSFLATDNQEKEPFEQIWNAFCQKRKGAFRLPVL